MTYEGSPVISTRYEPPGCAGCAQSGSQIGPQPGDVLDDDHRLALDHALDLEPHRRDRALLDGADRDVEVLGCGFLLDGSLISSTSIPRPAASWRIAVPQAMLSTPGWYSIGRSPICVAEAHHVEHHRCPVVGGVVGDLHGAHLLDALARPRQREGQQVGREPRIDTR